MKKKVRVEDTPLCPKFAMIFSLYLVASGTHVSLILSFVIICYITVACLAFCLLTVDEVQLNSLSDVIHRTVR